MFHHRPFRQLVVALSIVSLLAPMTGCGGGDNTKNVMTKASQWASNAWTKTRDASTGAWTFVSEKSSATWTVMADKAAAGTEAAWDASKSAMVWTKDRTVDGWQWISENASSASQWTVDATKNMWMVTREETGEFFLWVKVEAENGVAYVRTAVPEAWDVTKDAAGKAWVWINEHKVDAALVATSVAIVVAALMIEPVTATTLVTKGVVTKAGAGLFFRLYQDNQDELGELTEEQFAAIAAQVVAQNGDNAEQASSLGEESE